MAPHLIEPLEVIEPLKDMPDIQGLDGPEIIPVLAIGLLGVLGLAWFIRKKFKAGSKNKAKEKDKEKDKEKHNIASAAAKRDPWDKSMCKKPRVFYQTKNEDIEIRRS